MKINKSDLKDGFTFLWISILLFIVTSEVAFPFVMFFLKVVFYILGSLMLILGIGTMIRAFFRKEREQETLAEAEKKI